MWYSFLNVVTICIGFFVLKVSAQSLDELKQSFANTIMECAKQYTITSEEINQLKNRKLPESRSAKCLFACAYKKTGMMDDQGMMSVDGVRRMTQKYFSDKPDIIMKTDEFTNACKSVNEAAVSDGALGCDRAALIFKCSIDKAPQFDFGV